MLENFSLNVRDGRLGGNLKKSLNFYEVSSVKPGRLAQAVGEECKSFEIAGGCGIPATKKPPVSGWKRAAWSWKNRRECLCHEW